MGIISLLLKNTTYISVRYKYLNPGSEQINPIPGIVLNILISYCDSGYQLQTLKYIIEKHTLQIFPGRLV